MPLAAPCQGGKGMQANIYCLVQRLGYEKVRSLTFFYTRKIFRLFTFRLIATLFFSQ